MKASDRNKLYDALDKLKADFPAANLQLVAIGLGASSVVPHLGGGELHIIMADGGGMVYIPGVSARIGNRLPIRFAVIQSGYGVFGSGNTELDAVSDAIEWIDGVDSAAEVVDLLKVCPAHGEFYMARHTNADFNYYLEKQGCFENIHGDWYEKEGSK